MDKVNVLKELNRDYRETRQASKEFSSPDSPLTTVDKFGGLDQSPLTAFIAAGGEQENLQQKKIFQEKLVRNLDYSFNQSIIKHLNLNETGASSKTDSLLVADGTVCYSSNEELYHDCNESKSDNLSDTYTDPISTPSPTPIVMDSKDNQTLNKTQDIISESISSNVIRAPLLSQIEADCKDIVNEIIDNIAISPDNETKVPSTQENDVKLSEVNNDEGSILCDQKTVVTNDVPVENVDAQNQTTCLDETSPLISENDVNHASCDQTFDNGSGDNIFIPNQTICLDKKKALCENNVNEMFENGPVQNETSNQPPPCFDEAINILNEKPVSLAPVDQLFDKIHKECTETQNELNKAQQTEKNVDSQNQTFNNSLGDGHVVVESLHDSIVASKPPSLAKICEQTFADSLDDEPMDSLDDFKQSEQTFDSTPVNETGGQPNLLKSSPEKSTNCTFIEHSEATPLNATFAPPTLSNINDKEVLNETVAVHEPTTVNNCTLQSLEKTFTDDGKSQVLNYVNDEPMDIDNSFVKVALKNDTIDLTEPVLHHDEDTSTSNSPNKNEMPDLFKIPEAVKIPTEVSNPQISNTPSSLPWQSGNLVDDFSNEEFKSSSAGILSPQDFDYELLSSHGNAQSSEVRDSVLLRFDPLLSRPSVISSNNSIGAQSIDTDICDNKVSRPVKSPVVSDNRKSFNLHNNNNTKRRSTTVKTDPDNIKPTSYQLPTQQIVDISSGQGITPIKVESDDKMSLDMMSTENHENFKIEQNNLSSNPIKMENNDKKFKDPDAAIRAGTGEEALLKRLNEKEKLITKLNGVMQAYEKTIAELVSENEQKCQGYDKKCNELKSTADQNSEHLLSLEGTFTDFLAKYERSKQLTASLTATVESLRAENSTLQVSLETQEQRYQKMKNHAMGQLEIANEKLDSLTKQHQHEMAKLKAILKKEEISRNGLQEQLEQKTRENTELVKICDELIGGSGSS